ncbi:hypothetical protein AXF42_Ash017204 [Apostasia shenzhenica]|uniref:Uncharacterized protein n=1 Tax=Apostasia shenzhenica TaxID=1088818 RepID=A0A2H9ZVC4_9ASPA|nr:hypothetical protein AXF42_Ash017204 [Apostasia shenzhenica]
MPAATKDAESQHDSPEEKQPLLRREITVNPPDIQLSPAQKAIAKTFQSTAELAKLLPTGTVLAFQILSPLLTNGGDCLPTNRSMAAALVLLCALSCFALSFTDSFRDAGGKVRYGFATFRGMWVIDGTAQLTATEAAAYRMRFIDFAHGFMSVILFAAIALLDPNFVSCFYPSPAPETEQMLVGMPVAMGVLGGAFFVTFPTTRHGIGFPLSSR